jgi:hypothetical protein
VIVSHRCAGSRHSCARSGMSPTRTLVMTRDARARPPDLDPPVPIQHVAGLTTWLPRWHGSDIYGQPDETRQS